MKKMLVIFVLIIPCANLFSHGFTYGLSQEDLNLIMGQFVAIDQVSERNRWGERDFSWGRQPAIDTNSDMIIIDYYSVQASMFGAEYESHLIFFDTGLMFLIRDIEIISTERFVLSLAFLGYWFDDGIWVPIVEEGQMMFTFLDNRHVLIDDISHTQGFRFGVEWWKSAGPDVPMVTVVEDAEENLIQY